MTAKASSPGRKITKNPLTASTSLSAVARLTSAGFIKATVQHKTSLAVLLAGGESERVKCIGAIMELAGSATFTVVSALPSMTALTASMFNAYKSCQISPPAQ